MSVLLTNMVLIISVLASRAQDAEPVLYERDGAVAYLETAGEHELLPEIQFLFSADSALRGTPVRQFHYRLRTETSTTGVEGVNYYTDMSGIDVLLTEDGGEILVYSALVSWSFSDNGLSGHGEPDGMYHYSGTLGMCEEVRRVVEILDRRKAGDKPDIQSCE